MLLAFLLATSAHLWVPPGPSDAQLDKCGRIQGDIGMIGTYRDMGMPPKETLRKMRSFDPRAGTPFLKSAINMVYFDRIAQQMTPNELAHSVYSECTSTPPPWQPLK